MADFGLSQGLAFRIPYSEHANREIQDLQYAEQLRRQNEAMAMAKAKMLTDDMDMINSTSVYDSPLVKEAYRKRAQNIANITKQYPNWHTNPDAMALIKAEKQAMKLDEPVLRAIAYKDAKDTYLKFVEDSAKNPDKYNLDDLENFKIALQNYDKYGHEGGLEAAQKEGPKPLSFTPPQELINLNELYRKTGDSLDPDEFTTVNNGRLGAYKGVVSEKVLDAKAREIYQTNKRQLDYTYTKNGIDPVEKVKEGLRGFAKTVYDKGERNTFAEQMAIEKFKASARAAANNGVSVYDSDVLGKPHTTLGADYLSKIFTERPPFQILTPKGTLEVNNRDIFTPDGDIFDKQGAPKGIKEMPGYVMMDLDRAKKEGYVHDPFGPSGQDGTDYEVYKSLESQGVKMVPVGSKNGESKWMVQVPAVATVDAKLKTYRTRFDSEIAKMTTKQRDAAGVEDGGQEPPAAIKQNGYTYYYNPQTGQYE